MSEQDATNPVADDDVRVDDQPGVETETNAEQNDQAEASEEPEEGQPEDEAEEVEHDGQKYRIPKALKPALMMNADYTRKTQELAEHRRTWEQQRTQQAESFEALRSEHVQVATLESQVQAYEKYDWTAAYQQAAESDDPMGAQARLNSAYMQYQNLRNSLGEAKASLSQKEQARAIEQQRETAKQIEEGQAVLQRDIPGWSPELAVKLSEFGQSIGYSKADMDGVFDTRQVKLLHLAYLGQQTSQKQTAAKRQEKVAAVTPAKTVGARASGYKPGLDDSLPVDEWMRRRNAQRAKAR